MSAIAKVSTTTLRTFPIFETVDNSGLEFLVRAAELRNVARGEEVVHAGDPTVSIYFVLSGTLRVEVSDDEGREVILCILGPGEMFGEMGVLDDYERSASVVAVESSSLVVIGKAEFKRCLATNPDVALFIMRDLSRRLRLADRKIESLALLDVYGRVARLLIDMADTVDGMKIVTRKVTKQDIAKMVGASREMVSRVMRDLQLQGLILERDGQWVLIDLGRHKALSDY